MFCMFLLFFGQKSFVFVQRLKVPKELCTPKGFSTSRSRFLRGIRFSLRLWLSRRRFTIRISTMVAGFASTFSIFPRRCASNCSLKIVDSRFKSWAHFSIWYWKIIWFVMIYCLFGLNLGQFVFLNTAFEDFVSRMIRNNFDFVLVTRPNARK